MNISRISLLASSFLAFLLSFAPPGTPLAGAEEDIVKTVSDLVCDKDKDVRALGLEQVRDEVKGPEATRRFAALLPKLARRPRWACSGRWPDGAMRRPGRPCSIC